MSGVKRTLLLPALLTRLVRLHLAQLVSDDWSELPYPLVIDSGAAETVIPTDWCDNYPTRQGQAQKAGRYYTAANGEPVYNQGEKTILLASKDGSDLRKMTFQCTDVHKALGSVSQIVSKGNTAVFDTDGSYIHNKESGDVLWLEERNGVYVMPAHIAPHSMLNKIESGFPRQDV